MPDVEMRNQLATAVIHILPAWREMEQRALEGKAFHDSLTEVLGRYQEALKAEGSQANGNR